MLELAVDIETYSSTDIKFGVHKYAESPDFEILLIAFSYGRSDFGKGDVLIIDLASGEKVPENLLEALADPEVLKTAYNAAFEITCLKAAFPDLALDPSQWSCTQALAAQAGLPFGLDNVAKALGTTEQKGSEGKALIRYFSIPCKPTKANDMRSRNRPHHAFDKWLDFKEYCCQDVATEQSIRESLSWFTTPQFEKNVWALDQKINNAGVMVDIELVKNAIGLNARITEKTINELLDLTGVENPKSNAQIKQFILEASGEEVKSLSKANMAEVNALFKGTDIEDVLRLREKLSRTAVKKFDAMLASACKDGRIRGLFQYYGANRTGRWAGRNVQLQNLKRNSLHGAGLDLARELVRKGDLDILELCYSDVGDVLGDLIRTAFVPDEGCELVVADFSAIEARIIAWYAQEKWRLDVFSTHGKIYEASAAMMFKVPIETIGKGSPLRAKGKIAELALGYQGALGALQRMGGSDMGLSDDEMLALVKQWRRANPKIVQLWADVENCAIEALTQGRSAMRLLKFEVKAGNLLVQLPSGRKLVYIGARFNGQKITYMGMDQTTKKWGRQDTYGGKLVENIIQATARDVLVDAMLRLDAAGHRLIMHVHDEVVVEAPRGTVSEDYLTDLLSREIPWAPGLPLGAETFTANYYQK